jgi:predicted nucleotidyltransferase
MKKKTPKYLALNSRLHAPKCSIKVPASESSHFYAVPLFTVARILHPEDRLKNTFTFGGR